MDNSKKWEFIVEQYSKLFNEQEEKVQKEWEGYCVEFLGFSKLCGEIDSQRSIRIGSSERVIPDIILRKDDSDIFDIELKQYNLSFAEAFELQLISYLNQLHLSVGLIVCSKIYLYSYDYTNNNFVRMVIPFEKDNKDGIKLIELLNRDNFNTEEIKKFILSKDRRDKNIIEIKEKIDKQLMFDLVKEHFRQYYSEDEIDDALKKVEINVSDVFSPAYRVNHQIKPSNNDHATTNATSVIDSIINWCKERKQRGEIEFSEDNINRSRTIVRFTTKQMDSFLPPDDNRNVEWKNRDYFYEIDTRDNNLKIDIALKNRYNDKIDKIKKILSTESKEITNPNWEWKTCWKSYSKKLIELVDEDTINKNLDSQFEHVMSKEKSFFEKQQ